MTRASARSAATSIAPSATTARSACLTVMGLPSWIRMSISGADATLRLGPGRRNTRSKLRRGSRVRAPAAELFEQVEDRVGIERAGGSLDLGGERLVALGD